MFNLKCLTINNLIKYLEKYFFISLTMKRTKKLKKYMS